jgi:tetratricopeptide (TPR) repeat protein
MKQRPIDPLALARKAFQQNDFFTAQNYYQICAMARPGDIETELRLSVCSSMSGQPRKARTHAVSAMSNHNSTLPWVAELAEQLSSVGESEMAFRLIDSLQVSAKLPILEKGLIASVLHRVAKLDDSLNWISHAASEVGNDVSHAVIHAFHGQLLRFHNRRPEAHAAYNRAIQLDPHYGQSYLGRSQIERVTNEHHHIDDLRRVLARCKPNSKSEGQVAYALFKELDDIGDYAPAWNALEKAWRAKKAEKPYFAAKESAMFERMSLLTKKLKPAEAITNGDYPTPIFILGQPRSGSTLLERLLAQHPEVHAAGELFDFCHQLHWCADLPAQGFISIEAAERVSTQDLSNLGQRYLDRIRWRANGKKYLIDKLPPNYLYTGFIAKAIPNAIIIHSERNPMDTCYSQLKEWFDHGYEHSYNPDDMATHYLGYRSFMNRLHADLGGRIYNCQHSEIIENPQESAEKLFAHCGLSFKADYLSIEADVRPVSTASSSQVRKKINKEGIKRWLPYADKLSTMLEKIDT